MHRFVMYPAQPRDIWADLHGAHLVGADGVPVRAEIKLQNNTLLCEPRGHDPVGVSTLWPVKDVGVVQLQTTRLPPREQPYHLHVELARHQLMRITLKREEWGLFDYSGMDEIADQINQARELFVQALEAHDPVAAARLADRSLSIGMLA